MADSSASTEFTITAAAFSLVQLAFCALGGIGVSYIRNCPSQGRLQEWRDIIEGWKRWLNSLSSAERDLFEAQTPGMLFMADTLFQQEIHVERLTVLLRAASWSDRYNPLGELQAVFVYADQALGVMDREFLNTTKRLRPEFPAPQLSSSRGREYQGTLLPTVNPQAMNIEAGDPDAGAQAESAIETHRTSMLARLRLGRIDSKNLRDVVARANEAIGNILRAAQEYRESLRRGAA